MAVKLRLRQQGRHGHATYRIVATDSRNPRDGRYVEQIGWYNPNESEAEKNLFVDGARVQYWLGVGAQMSEKTEVLITKAAPQVVRAYKERQVLRREKTRAQNKARRHKQKAAK